MRKTYFFRCLKRTQAYSMSRLVGKPTMWHPNRSDTNRAVQTPKMVRDWKFWIEKVEELYYPCSENKGADQLRSYCEADLRLCFRIIMQIVGFPMGRLSIDFIHALREWSVKIIFFSFAQNWTLHSVRASGRKASGCPKCTTAIMCP